MSPTVFVFAGSYAQASDWARSNGIPPSRWIYLNSARQLLGVVNPDVRLVGTVEDRADFAAICETIASKRNR